MVIDKLILKFICRSKRLGTANIIVKEENKTRGLTLLSFKIYYKYRSSNQDNVVLVKEETKRTMEQNRELKNTTT